MKNRDSISVKIGRFIQKYYYHLGFIDDIFTSYKIDSVPIICIVGAPRSGTTLAYQVLTEAFENNHLTNFSNLVYATPVLGFKIQKKLCLRYINKYSSNHGFVSGLCGEAEGLKFWNYWSKQKLEETDSLDAISLKKLHCRLRKIDNKPFITGYLGLSFSIDLMRNEFKNILFVNLKRDMLSTCYSLYKFYGKNNELMSIVPKACVKKRYSSKHEMVVDQIMQMHKCISIKKDNDFINITYKELCEDPNGILDKIQNKASEMNFKLEIKNTIPSFTANIVSKNLNNDTKIIYDIIRRSCDDEI